MMTLARTNRGRKMVYAPDYFGGVFDSFFNDSHGRAVSQKSVPTNISEDEKAYSIELAIPGFSKEDVNINIEEEVLKIAGKKEGEENKEGSKFTRRDFSFAEFEKSYRLPDSVLIDKINASFKDGILTIELPKKEPAKPLNIKVDVK